MFPLGQLLATPGALAALEAAKEPAIKFFARHKRGEWGDLSDDDKAANDASVKNGSRILSAYFLKDGTKLWVITEAVGDDGKRAATTILRSDEY